MGPNICEMMQPWNSKQKLCITNYEVSKNFSFLTQEMLRMSFTIRISKAVVSKKLQRSPENTYEKIPVQLSKGLQSTTLYKQCPVHVFFFLLLLFFLKFCEIFQSNYSIKYSPGQRFQIVTKQLNSLIHYNPVLLFYTS